MNLAIMPFIIILLIAGAIAFILAYYSNKAIVSRLKEPFIVMMASVGLWCVIYSLELMSGTYDQIMFWKALKYFGIVTIPVAILIVGLRYAGYDDKVDNRIIGLLSIIPIITIISVLTNNWHHLFYESATLYQTDSFTTVLIVDGPLYWQNAIYSYTCLFIGLALIINTTVRNKVGHFKIQTVLFVLACIIPFLGNFIYNLGQIPSSIGYDPTPLCFLISGVLMFWSIAHYRFFDILPCARKHLFDALPDAIFVFDADNTLVEYNDIAESLMKKGYVSALDPKLAEENGFPCPSEAPDILEVISKTSKEDKEITLDDGIQRQFFDTTRIPIYDQMMNDIGTTILLRDVTERKKRDLENQRRAETIAKYHDALLLLSKRSFTSLKQTENTFAEISMGVIDTDQVGIWMFSGVDVLDCHVLLIKDTGHTHFNPLRRSDYPRYFAELEMNKVIDANDATHDIRTEELSETYLEKYSICSLLDVGIMIDGKTIGVLCFEDSRKRSWSQEELDFASSLADLLSLAIESDNHRQAEERILMQNKELKKLDKLKSNFLNVTSHELRTPITAMKGYVQMLLDKQLGEVPDEQQKALLVIQRNANRLTMLVNDILDTSRLESGTMKFNLKSVDIDPFLNKVVKTMKESAKTKNIDIHLDVDPMIPVLTVDPDKIHQVLDNLLTNAIKFSPENTNISVSAFLKDDIVIFEVEDQGIGIPREKQHKVFSKFYQVKGGVDRAFGGTGLGLAVCRGIVIGHGGRIWIEESDEEKGSAFRFSLPINPVFSGYDKNPDVVNIFENESST